MHNFGDQSCHQWNQFLGIFFPLLILYVLIEDPIFVQLYLHSGRLLKKEVLRNLIAKKSFNLDQSCGLTHYGQIFHGPLMTLLTGSCCISNRGILSLISVGDEGGY